MRVVLDVNVLVAAMLAPNGAPALLVVRWLNGDFELIVADQLLSELGRALKYPKVRQRVSPREAAALIRVLRASATTVKDVDEPPRRSLGAGDDDILPLAAESSAILVTGDRDILDPADLPIYSPNRFLSSLDKLP